MAFGLTEIDKHRGEDRNNDLIELHIAQAEFYASRSSAKKTDAGQISYYRKALKALQSASVKAPAHLAPSRYKQIAKLYIDYAAKKQALGEEDTLSLAEARSARIFKLILTDLES